MRFLLIPLILYPLLELWVLFKVSAAIGILATLALIVATGVAGVTILRRVGWHTLSQVNLKLNRGETPTREIAEGVALAVGGLLLLLPGLIGDVVGLLFLLPAGRRWLQGHGAERTAYAGPAPHRDRAGPATIEGEYRRED